MDDLDPQVLLGIEFFNLEQFYESHDEIEAVWLVEASDMQPFLQGLIQTAVAFHHYQQGRLGAARSMLKLALEKLEGFPEWFRRVHLSPLREQLKTWAQALDEAVASGARRVDLLYPKIQFSQEVASG